MRKIYLISDKYANKSGTLKKHEISEDIFWKLIEAQVFIITIENRDAKEKLFERIKEKLSFDGAHIQLRHIIFEIHLKC